MQEVKYLKLIYYLNQIQGIAIYCKNFTGLGFYQLHTRTPTQLHNMSGRFTPRMLFLTPEIGHWKNESWIEILDTTPVTYASWDTECDGQVFLSFWAILLPFYLPNNLKNQNFEKMKKTPGDIILYMPIINDNYMMYGSCDMERDGQIFFVILGYFLLF